jgi:hypothetical protein
MPDVISFKGRTLVPAGAGAGTDVAMGRDEPGEDDDGLTAGVGDEAAGTVAPGGATCRLRGSSRS